MARTFAPLLVAIWNDADFLALDEGPQRIYFVANSQSNMTYCGVVPFMPVSWSALASNSTATKIRRDVKELEDARFVILDRRTEELWVKSFIKHNNVMSQPNVVKAMKASYETIRSAQIKQAVYRSVPTEERHDMTNPFGSKPPPKVEPFEEPFTEGVAEGNGKPLDPTQGLGSQTQDLDLDLDSKPLPESDPPPQSQPEPQRVTTTAPDPATNAAEIPPDEEDDYDEEIMATPQEEEIPTDPLVDMVLSICSIHRDKIMTDAILVVNHLRDAGLDDRRIEESLGWCTKNLKTRPGNPRFLLVTIGKWAERGGITVPPLSSVRRVS